MLCYVHTLFSNSVSLDHINICSSFNSGFSLILYFIFWVFFTYRIPLLRTLNTKLSFMFSFMCMHVNQEISMYCLYFKCEICEISHLIHFNFLCRSSTYIPNLFWISFENFQEHFFLPHEVVSDIKN